MNRTTIAVSRFLNALQLDDEVLDWEAGPYDEKGIWVFKRRRTGTARMLLDDLPVLVRLNRSKWSIFVRPSKRLIYIDDMTPESERALRAYGVEPRATVQTSLNRLQVWLDVPTDVDRVDLYIAIERRFGADVGARPSRGGTARLARLPGFMNTKPNRDGQWVLLRSATSKPQSEVSVRLIRELAASGKILNTPPAPPRAMSAAPPPRQPSTPAAAIRGAGTDSSPSAKDCSDAMRMLARRVPAAEVEAMLVARATARYKHSPSDYARRTVVTALRFLEQSKRG